MPDFSTYQPPGTYIEEETTSLVSVFGVSPTVIGIVGPAVGYRSFTEAVTLTGNTPVALTKLGVFPPANVTHGASFVVAAADGTAFTNTTDFTVAVGPGADASASATLDNTTTIARAGAGIPEGATVYVTYRYQDAAYYAPFRAQDYDDVKDAFGEPLNLVTGAILSPLSLAAKVAFENGAREVVLVPTLGTASGVTTANLSAAIATLDSLPDVNVVVPLPVGITGTAAAPGDLPVVGASLAASLVSGANSSLYRVGILGFERTVTADPGVLSASFRSARVMLAWPNRLNYYNGFNNTTIEVSGYYLAAAYAGRMAAQEVQIPLTKKQIRGFSGIPASVLQTMTATQKNTWSAGGVAVAEVDRNSRLIVRHGVSTAVENINVREISLTRAKDAVVNLLQETMDRSDLIGQPIDAEMPIRIKGVVSGVLETVVGLGTIVAYQNLKVRQRSIDPSVIEVRFQYRPAYPLNYVVISFSINTQTGEVNPLDLAA